MLKELSTALQQNHITLSTAARDKLLHYLEAMRKWNKVINLTSITDINEMVYLHLIDSLIIAPYLTGKRFLDVGTGAGLPGIPLAILHPETNWVLLDKCGKKTRFLTQMKIELGLSNVEIAETTVTQFHPTERFDSIVSRAFGTLRLLTESTKHLLNPDGAWFLLKGKYPEDELKDLPDFVHVAAVQPIHMQGRALERHLICCSIRG